MDRRAASRKPQPSLGGKSVALTALSPLTTSLFQILVKRANNLCQPWQPKPAKPLCARPRTSPGHHPQCKRQRLPCPRCFIRSTTLLSYLSGHGCRPGLCPEPCATTHSLRVWAPCWSTSSAGDESYVPGHCAEVFRLAGRLIRFWCLQQNVFRRRTGTLPPSREFDRVAAGEATLPCCAPLLSRRP